MHRYVLTCAGGRLDMAAASSGLVVRVKRELITACMTCPICKKLLRDATTISECLHTFCRKCIFEKLNDEEMDCCPVCNIDLGCAPLEKLRADHIRQDIRAKIFPLKRRKVDAPEIVPSIVLPVKRKERSLSSLVVNTPRVATHSGLTGRRTKSTTRRASSLRGLGPIMEVPTKEVKNSEDHAEPSSQNKRKSSSSADSSDYILNKNNDYTKASSKDHSELWKPLNCLVEAANRTKAVKPSSQSSDIKEEQINGTDNEVHMDKVKVKEHPNKLKIQKENNNSTLTSSVKVRARRLQCKRKSDLENSAQALVDAASANSERRNSPIWLALVPAIDQKKDAGLPQTSTCYLRIKDGNLPVSFVRKYIVKKHNLASESQVEITCRSQILNPTVPLYNLAETWLQSQPPQRVQTTIGTSARDFVLVLNYSLRASTS